MLSLEIDDAVKSDEESKPDSLMNFPQARKQHVVLLDFWDAEVTVMTEEVRNLNIPWQYAAPSILETTDAGVLSVLLMSFTPNLYHLSIGVNHRHLDLLLNLAKRLGDGVSRPLGLKNLRSLHLACFQDGRSSVTFRDVASLLHLLHLTEFQLMGCAGYSWEEATQSRLLGVLDKPLSLSTLAVIESDLDAASMELLCRSCKKLTVFHYDEGDMGSEQLSHG